ncbi:hypothetical protein ACIOHS_25745 [Streptomyces sp. NPDC088253]|uniref:hypothetical protein n=1 Tax=Streptomyces sp. NPDC088253 TaxID=3365846 RepID=UPI0037F278E7
MRHSPGPLPRRATAYEKRTEPPRHLTLLIEHAPAYSNTPGRDAGVLDLGSEIRGRGDQLGVRLVSQRDAVWVGALLAAVDAQQ